MDKFTKKNCLSVADFNTVVETLDKCKLSKAFDILINRNKRLSDLHFAQGYHYKRQMYDFIIRNLLVNYSYQYGNKRQELNFEELISEVESNFKNNPYYISIEELN